MTLVFRFCSVLYGVGFGLGSCTFFTFGFDSVLDKTWVLVWFFLAVFWLFPIFSANPAHNTTFFSGFLLRP